MNLNENHLLFVSIPTPQVGAMFIYRTVYEQSSWYLQQSNNCDCASDTRAAHSAYSRTGSLEKQGSNRTLSETEYMEHGAKLYFK